MFILTELLAGEKWKVTYDTLDQLKKGEVTFLQQPTGPGSYNLPAEAGRQMAVEFGIMAAEGIMDVSSRGLRNDVFPDVRPVTIEELVTRAWKKKD